MPAAAMRRSACRQRRTLPAKHGAPTTLARRCPPFAADCLDCVPRPPPPATRGVSRRRGASALKCRRSAGAARGRARRRGRGSRSHRVRSRRRQRTSTAQPRGFAARSRMRGVLPCARAGERGGLAAAPEACTAAPSRRGPPGAPSRAGGACALPRLPPRTPARRSGAARRAPPQRLTAPRSRSSGALGAQSHAARRAAGCRAWRHATAARYWRRCRTKLRARGYRTLKEAASRTRAHLTTPSRALRSASVTPFRTRIAGRCVRICPGEAPATPHAGAARACRSLSARCARLAPLGALRLRGRAVAARLPRQQRSARLRAALCTAPHGKGLIPPSRTILLPPRTAGPGRCGRPLRLRSALPRAFRRAIAAPAALSRQLWPTVPLCCMPFRLAGRPAARGSALAT